MSSLCVEDIVALKQGSNKAYHRIRKQILDIIYSRLSNYPDIGVYINDLISNAFIVLLRTYDNYDKSKAKFSTYLFNRIISASRRQYMALRYPYGGIKSLSGRRNVEIDQFRDSSLAYLISDQDAYNKEYSTSIDDVDSYIRTILNSEEDDDLLLRVRGFIQNQTDFSRRENQELLRLVKERIGEY